MVEMVTLGYAACADRLAAGGTCRAAVCTPLGPRVLPVTYTVDGDWLYLRTTAYSDLGTHGPDRLVALEIDCLDDGHREGWSVVALGRLETVRDVDELDRLGHLPPPAPWAGHPPWLYLRMRLQNLSGWAATEGRPAATGPVAGR